MLYIHELVISERLNDQMKYSFLNACKALDIFELDFKFMRWPLSNGKQNRLLAAQLSEQCFSLV